MDFLYFPFLEQLIIIIIMAWFVPEWGDEVQRGGDLRNVDSPALWLLWIEQVSRRVSLIY